MKKVIYVYQKDNNSSTYKIGKADQRQDQDSNISIEDIAKNRISEQLTAESYGKFNLIETYDISHVDSSSAVEGGIHEGIELKGFKRLNRSFEGKKGTSEWFDFENLTKGQVKEIVKELVEKCAGKSGLAKYKPRAYQAYVEAQLLDQLSEGHNIIGTELAPRFGKTLWTFATFKKMVEDFNYQYLILPSYVLTSHSSFQSELRKFKDFDNMIFISDKDNDFKERVNKNKDKILVITTSLHAPEDSFHKYKVIKDLDKNKKVAFVDEADFGAHTDNSKKRMDLLDVKTKILMTGTAIERAVAGYEISSIIKWSYMDMLTLKKDNHPILDKLVA